MCGRSSTNLQYVRVERLFQMSRVGISRCVSTGTVMLCHVKSCPLSCPLSCHMSCHVTVMSSGMPGHIICHVICHVSCHEMS